MSDILVSLSNKRLPRTMLSALNGGAVTQRGSFSFQLLITSKLNLLSLLEGTPPPPPPPPNIPFSVLLLFVFFPHAMCIKISILKKNIAAPGGHFATKHLN